jgi:RNA polymerase sigma-70 factor (ECF subfamily)
VKDEFLAEDLIQELFIKLWLRRTDFQFQYSEKAYLYRAIVNAAINLKESTRPMVTLDYLIEESSPNGHNQLQYQDLVQELDLVTEQLTRAQRKIYRLSRYEGLSRHEISQQLSLSLKTVDNHLSSASTFVKENMRNYVKN